MQLASGLATDIGRKRTQNQDSGCAVPELGLYVVADGMGGHQGGETASQMAVEVIPDQVRKSRPIDEAIRSASRAIYERSLKEPQLRGMGTTTTALYFQGNQLQVGHVGDSRCYLIRGPWIWQLTRDHSLVQERFRAGLITREQMKTDKMRNVITRSVGFDGGVQVDVYTIAPQVGDVFLVCSDGLTTQVDETQLLSIVTSSLASAPRDLQKAAVKLVAAANENGGDDNITALLVQVLP